MKTTGKRYILPIIALISVLAGMILRWYWIVNGRFPFNSDEAIVGLMARHILAGNTPVFFYGQAYMGSLDAWLVAFGFRIWGQSINTIRLVQAVLWVGLIISVFLLTRKIFKRTSAGWWAVLLIGLPPINQVLYSTVTLGGYNEGLIIGLWCIYLAICATEYSKQKSSLAYVFGLGVLSGFGVWVFGLSLVFSLPAIIFVFVDLYQKKVGDKSAALVILAVFLGGCIGASAWWIYAFQHGLAPMLQELTGSAVAVEKGNLLAKIFTHLVGLILLGIPAALGFRPPWSVAWLMLPLIPIVLFMWIMVVLKAKKHIQEYPTIKILISIPILLFVVFLFSSFGVDPSGRYFLPVSLVLTILAGGVFANWKPGKYPVPVLMAGVIVLFQLGGSIQANAISTNGITTQFAPDTSISENDMVELIRFLRAENITSGYSDYWTAYPLAFRTEEKAIFVPRLPYHHDFSYTLRDDRYSPYTDQVYASSQNAYITYQNPGLDQKIEDGFTKLNISWQKDNEVPGFTVYFHLSTTVTPEQIGLGGALIGE